MALSEVFAERLSETARILVVRLDGIGDAIMCAGFFIALRNLFPNGHITAVLDQKTTPLYAEGALFDALVSPGGGAIQSDYDLAICPRWDVDYYGEGRIALDSGAPIRIGFLRPDDPRDSTRSEVFTHTVHVDADMHEVDKSAALLRLLDETAVPPPPRLFIPVHAQQDAGRWRAKAGREDIRYAVLGISAGNANRIWPVENFLSVVDILESQYGLQCVAVGDDTACASGRWLEKMRPASLVSAAGCLDLMSSAALISHAVVYVGMDSGPMHMAAASGVPVVEISCHPLSGSAGHHNAPDRFGPYGTRNVVVRPAKPHAPCSLGCHQLDIAHCITLVPPNDVITALHSLMLTVA